MERYVDDLIGRYRRAGILVDTNLLLLFFVGDYDRVLVERFKRTANKFVAEDFDTLCLLLEQFNLIITTPHVLTEVSNWLGNLSEPAKTRCFNRFAQLIRSAMHEQYTSGSSLSDNSAFVSFGIADASIYDTARDSYLVLTDDLPLYAYLSGNGVDVLNFNEIRTIAY